MINADKHIVKRKERFLKSLLIMMCLIFMFAAAGCGAKKEETVTSYDQLKEPGTVIALAMDTPEGDLVMEKYPDAEIKRYPDMQNAYPDVVNGRVDACIYARTEMELAMENGVKGVRLLDENFYENIVAVGLSKKSGIPHLEDKINKFIKELKDDGTLDDMYQRWVIDEDYTMPDIPEAVDPQITLTVGTTGTVMPYSYFEGTDLSGYDIELAKRFAAWLGAGLEFKVYDFGGVVTAAQSGDVDCVMSNLYYTEEKTETMPFSDPLFTIEVTAMVKDTGGQEAVPEYTSLDDLDGKLIGIQTGSIFTPFVEERLPNAKISYYNNSADLIGALETHKIDSFPMDEFALNAIMKEDDQIDHLEEYLDEVEIAMVFAKTKEGQKICDEMSEWLISVKESGELENIKEKWIDGPDEEKTIIDPESLPDINGTLSVATEGGFVPFSYIADGKISGYEFDLITRFCRDKGYGLDVEIINFDGILMAVQNGQVDFGASGFAITEERKEKVLFSEPYYHSGTVMAVLKEKPETGFLSDIKTSFEKTFIRENRWKLFVKGIGTTLLITVMSIILGTLLGFVVFMACRNGNRIANKITGFFVWLVDGMPVVVLLMILYYIIFGSVQISGTIVSIAGFTLIFASAVFAMLKSGVSAVDIGQTEAAYALGFTDRRAFYKVVLPQAMPLIMPSFKSQITALIKATAVVGYIAVQDLTKMGDIVRSRTYDAFFPLIAVAIVYFILAALLTKIVNSIEPCFNPERRDPEEILKGVKTE